MTALVTVRCNKIFMSSESFFSTQWCKRYQRLLVSPDTRASKAREAPKLRSGLFARQAP